MSARRRIRHLAADYDIPLALALKRLAEQKFAYSQGDQQVAMSSLAEVIRVIRGLEPPSPQQATFSPEPPDLLVADSARSPQPRRPITRRAYVHQYETPPKSRTDRHTGPLRHQYDWPIVGNAPKRPVAYLSAETVMKIHLRLVQDFATDGDPIEPAGVRDKGELLASALGRPQTSLGGVLKYPTIEMASAALLHAIIHNHPFHNGNKRTAIVSFLVFLDQNGYVLTSSDDDLFDYVLALAAHENAEVFEELSISDRETVSAARWVSLHSRKTSNSERMLKWRQLETILGRYDCVVENREGNSLAIKRGRLISHAGRRNDGDELDRFFIAKIRKELELDDEHGVDSQVFYYDDDVIPNFINKYRKILTKLAAY